jgi:hypothetical protein
MKQLISYRSCIWLPRNYLQESMCWYELYFIFMCRRRKMVWSNNSFCRFEKAKNKIATKYDEIERSLIEEFVKAHRSDDKGRMKEIATILSHFKGYPQCVDAFIEQSQMVRWFPIQNFVCICFPYVSHVPPISLLPVWSSKIQSSLLCNFLDPPS